MCSNRIKTTIGAVCAIAFVLLIAHCGKNSATTSGPTINGTALLNVPQNAVAVAYAAKADGSMDLNARLGSGPINAKNGGYQITLNAPPPSSVVFIRVEGVPD